MARPAAAILSGCWLVMTAAVATAAEISVDPTGMSSSIPASGGLQQPCRETFTVGGMNACRLVVGMWQVSGSSWGDASPTKRVEAMVAHAQAGFSTFDMADHYGPAETLYAKFRREYEPMPGLPPPLAFTKWVPRPGHMSRAVVESNIKRSLDRMGVDTLDMMQFHWWDYSNREYLTALRHMQDMKQEGTIRSLALTNFDSERLGIMLSEGLEIDANQVQYSLVDGRPAVKMAPLCEKHGVKLLAYGTLLGGLLTDKWLGKQDPRRQLRTPSEGKYYRMIESWGGWDLFQDLLRACRRIADKHGVSIANVAIRAILDKPAVGAVIVGARLGISSNIDDNLRVFDFQLDEQDQAELKAVTSRGRDLMSSIGDCGDEYRGGR